MTSTETMDDRSNGKGDGVNKGVHEDHLFCGQEASLNSYTNCKKQSTHGRFIPFTDLNEDHLPKRYRKSWLLRFIFLTGYLTVRISVAYVSKRRPDRKPGSEDPYHLHDQRGREYNRTGSGRIYNIIKQDPTKDNYHQPCPCGKCKKSGRRTAVWLEMHVYTACHLVFNEAESKTVLCRLEFDSQNSPLTNIDGFRIISADTENDTCRLACATCDKVLVNNVCEKMNAWDELRTGLRKHFIRSPHTLKLVVIISHPHGCAKMVSIGKWTHREHVGVSSSRYFYDCPTCPGTSGACVMRFDVKRRLYFDHVHSGVDGQSRNYSGVGLR